MIFKKLLKIPNFIKKIFAFSNISLTVFLFFFHNNLNAFELITINFDNDCILFFSKFSIFG